jgi:O-acetyl-ADP-ribose deacetylase (regulator of RNase III)
MEYLFFDKHSAFPEAIEKLFKDPNVKAASCDVRSIERSGTIFVSPGNSFGVMNGGIDEIYSTYIFPHSQSQARSLIENLPTVNEYGKPYLPIGQAVLLPPYNGSQLLLAPTMYIPENVSNTQNAYIAMKAIIDLVNQTNGYKYVAIPALCCGHGCMTPEESASQIYKAYKARQNVPNV